MINSILPSDAYKTKEMMHLAAASVPKEFCMVGQILWSRIYAIAALIFNAVSTLACAKKLCWNTISQRSYDLLQKDVVKTFHSFAATLVLVGYVFLSFFPFIGSHVLLACNPGKKRVEKELVAAVETPPLPKEPLTGAIDLRFDSYLQASFMLASDPKYLDFNHYLDFQRRVRPGQSRGEILHMFFQATCNSPLGRVLEKQIDDPRDVLMQEGKIRDSEGKEIIGYQDDVYFTFHIESEGLERRVDLPSHMFFDEDGNLIDPVSFYIEDAFFRVSLKDTLASHEKKVGQNYFTPDSIRKLRKFHHTHLVNYWNYLTEENVFSLISPQSLQFKAVIGENQELAFPLVPYETKEIPPHEDTKVLPIAPYSDGQSSYIVFDVVGYNPVALQKKLSIVFDNTTNRLWIHLDELDSQLPPNCVTIGRPWAFPPKAKILHLKSGDFNTATLRVENGRATLKVQGHLREIM